MVEFRLVQRIAQHHDGRRVKLRDAPRGFANHGVQTVLKMLRAQLTCCPCDVGEMLWTAFVHLPLRRRGDDTKQLHILFEVQPSTGPEEVRLMLRGELVNGALRYTSGCTQKGLMAVACSAAGPHQLHQILRDEGIDLLHCRVTHGFEGGFSLEGQLGQTPGDQGNVQRLKLVGPRDDGAQGHAKELVDGRIILVADRCNGPNNGGQVLPREAPHEFHGAPRQVRQEVRVVVPAGGQRPG
mmetsp:Transcript_56234/g.122992  ORF Transcript_56234/g.122992 Transcript_56234/m.122992 type:complete len:240 (-) Transcript_56234:545-1264(-)